MKKRQARFRWFLAYTIVNNYRLLDLRKFRESRVIALHAMQNYSIDEEYSPQNSAFYQSQFQTTSSPVTTNSGLQPVEERNTEYRDKRSNIPSTE